MPSDPAIPCRHLGPGRGADPSREQDITLFLAGDVMTGRGIDQVLPSPGAPGLHEPNMPSALDYVARAVRQSGPIDLPVRPATLWGDALEELSRRAPALRLVNLETAVTAGGQAWPGKRYHFRMHPDNLAVLSVAGIDGCALANNHVLDWGESGLLETLDTLAQTAIRTAGAGRDSEGAAAPAIFPLPGGGRLLFYAFAAPSGLVPGDWYAGPARPGVNGLMDISEDTVSEFAIRLGEVRREHDIVVASLHWGGNWGFEISAEERRFTHALIDRAGVDLVHGHSTHHVKGIEVYRGRLILYGCGDLINDYEMIADRRGYRNELALMYFPCLDAATGRLRSLAMVPLRRRRFCLSRAGPAEAQWLSETLNREGRLLGTAVKPLPDGSLALTWSKGHGGLPGRDETDTKRHPFRPPFPRGRPRPGSGDNG